MRAKTLPLLAALALPACESDTAPKDTAVTLSFEAFVGTAPASCGTTYTGLGAAASDAQIADARLFVSQIALRKAGGTAWVPLTLDAGSNWQNGEVALLDFEDGTAGCADSGTAAQNGVVTGTAPSGDYDAVRFTVGVPFASNHIDNATAAAPLNAPGMFWVWRGGYKFVRVDLAPVGGAVPRWNLHVGSTGCVSAAPTSAPDAPCGRPNTSTIELTGFDPSSSVIAIDLAKLVAGADLSVNQADSPPGCMSDPGEGADCATIFGNLGIDFETGATPTTGSLQSVFSVQ